MKKTKEPVIVSSLKLVQTAVMTALLVLGKFVLSFVPNIEVVTTLTVAFAFVFGWPSLAAATLFCLIDAVIYPPTLDVFVSYLIYWNLLAVTALVMRQCGVKRYAAYTAMALVMTLCFGLLTSATFSLFYGVNFLVYYAAGLPFYAIQLLSTLAFMTVGFKPLVGLLKRFIRRGARVFDSPRGENEEDTGGL